MLFQFSDRYETERTCNVFVASCCLCFIKFELPIRKYWLRCTLGTSVYSICTQQQKTTRIPHSMRRRCVECARNGAYVLNVPAKAHVRIMCDCSTSFTSLLTRLISQRAVIIRFSSFLFRYSVSRMCCVPNAHLSPVWYGNLSSRELKCLRNTIHGNLFITYILSVTLWMLTLTLQVSVQRTT